MPPETITERLLLRAPEGADGTALFAIQSDPRVWTHYPSLRYTDPAQTDADIRRCRERWRTVGLASWTVRRRDTGEIIGYGGCSPVGTVWNLGYRLAAEAQGQGLATELARAAIAAASACEPDLPIVAKLLEHNLASRRVAVKLGFDLAYRARDTGNPDASAVRLIYADRTLTREDVLAITS